MRGDTAVNCDARNPERLWAIFWQGGWTRLSYPTLYEAKTGAALTAVGCSLVEVPISVADKVGLPGWIVASARPIAGSAVTNAGLPLHQL